MCLGKDKASGRYEGDWWGMQGFGGNFRSQYTSDLCVQTALSYPYKHLTSFPLERGIKSLFLPFHLTLGAVDAVTSYVLDDPEFQSNYGQWRTEGGWGVNPPPKFRSFDKVEPDCKLSGKCLMFLFQHPN